MQFRSPAITNQFIDLLCVRVVFFRSSETTSDLGRTMATAKALTKGLKGIEIRTDQRLREQHFGDFQGKTFPEIAEIVGSDKFGEYAAVVKGVGGADLTFPNGENQLHVLERSLQAVQEIVRAHEGETVLVVTHGVVLQTLLKHFLGIPVTEPRTFATINTFSMKIWPVFI